MKKILIMLGVITSLLITTNNDTHASTSLYSNAEMEDTWELHYKSETLRLDNNIAGHIYKSGWYLFNFDFSQYLEQCESQFNEITIYDDMYTPQLNDDVELKMFYVEYEIELNPWGSMVIGNAINDALYFSSGETICYYSSVYPKDTVAPVFETNDVYTYTTQRESINDIKNRIYAYDKKDGDVSHNIAIIKESYSHDKNEGIKEVDLQVNDAAGNIAYHTVKIHVIDDYTSIITACSIYTTTSNPLTNEFILKEIEAYDYLGNSFDVTIISNEYENNTTKSGVYEIVVSGVDQFNDYYEQTFDITVYNCNHQFYSYDQKTLYFEEFYAFTNEELIDLLNVVTFNRYEYVIALVDSKISQIPGEHYVFYELHNVASIEEVRLSICFANANAIPQVTVENTFNISNYITTLVTATVLILFTLHMISHAIEKRK